MLFSVSRIQTHTSGLKAVAIGTDPIEWPELTRRIGRGDAAALETSYDRTFDVMFSEACRVLRRDEATHLDIVQDAMLKALESIKPLPDENAVMGWARLVARSVAYDWLRRHRRHTDSLANRSRTEQESGDVLDQAHMAWIEEQVAALPADLQRLFHLRYRWGWSLRRIGQALGLTPGAVDGRIRREVHRLRQQAEQEFDHELV